MKQYNIAIVGATGLVGQTFLKVLEEYEIPIRNLRLFASPKSEGKTVRFSGKDYTIETVKQGVFEGIDYALFSAGAYVSSEVAVQAVNEGAIVIDNSSAFRMNEGIPLVVPEVNLVDAFGKNVIANPNCSTIQSVIPIHALNKEYGVSEVTYHTYQAVSGSGYKGLQALKEEKSDVYPYDIKETCIPEIGTFHYDGYTTEEYKMIQETRKILHEPNLLVSATCVRVPVSYGHAVSMKLKLKKPFDMDDIRKTLTEQEGLVVLDDPMNHIYPTSIQAVGNDKVYVGRIRRDLVDPQAVLLYVVADNVRKGAASNAVQIMKGLMEHVEGR